MVTTVMVMKVMKSLRMRKSVNKRYILYISIIAPKSAIFLYDLRDHDRYDRSSPSRAFPCKTKHICMYVVMPKNCTNVQKITQNSPFSADFGRKGPLMKPKI